VPPEKDVLTTGDVARLCRVTIRTVIRWYDDGRLEGYRLPGSGGRRFTRDSVVRFLQQNEMPSDLLAPARPGGPAAQRVLVVDDDEAVRTLVARALTATGSYTVETAASGWEAGLKTATLRPHLLILDFRLGDTTGDEVVRVVRGQDLSPRPAILMLSAHLTGPDVARVLAEGADAFLAKPFTLEDLRGAVARLSATVR
jgi:excisionase family DNA binding protein